MSPREPVIGRIPAVGEIWSVATDPSALALVVDSPLREFGEHWWGVVRIERDADAPTLRPGDTIGGQGLRVELGDQLALPRSSFDERVGKLTPDGELAVEELFATDWPQPPPQPPARTWLRLRAIHADALAAAGDAADAFKRTLLDALAVHALEGTVSRALLPACAPMSEVLDVWPGADQWREAERALREALTNDIRAAALHAVPDAPVGPPLGWPISTRSHALDVDVMDDADGRALVVDGLPDELELSAPLAVIAPTPGIAPSAWAWSTPGVLRALGPVDSGRLWFGLPGDVSRADVVTIARSLLLLPPALGS